MADAEQTRVDREYLNKLELYMTEQALYRLAEYITASTATGAIYGQVILPPEYAAAKQQAMQQGGQ